MYQRAIENLREAFQRLWAAPLESLVLDVGDNQMRWLGNVVYSNENRSESIAWVLFKDGVRTVTFQPGFEEDEIVGLLDVLHRARMLQADANDDLLTLLWEKDFQRFQYVFQDLTVDTGVRELPSAQDIVPPSTNPASVKAAVEEEAQEEEGEEAGGGEGGVPRAQSGLVRAEDFDTTLYFLDESEIEYLRKSVQQEYSQDLRRNVLAMLYDILELQPYATVRAEVMGILEAFLPYLLGAVDFGSVAYVLRESKTVLQRAREVLPEQREALERLPARLSESAVLTQLLQALDDASVKPVSEELGELFAELRPEALPALFQWLPKLTNPSVTPVVEQAVERLAVANPGTVVAALQSTDPNMAITAIRLAAKLKLQAAVAPLGALFQHSEPAMRSAAVQALADIGSPGAIQAMERGLEDADREVRLASLRVIAQHKSRSALPRITAVVQGKSVRAADLTEKMVFFEAYGLLAGESAVEYLDGLLNSGGFLKRKEEPQTRACAAMALGKIGTPAARQCLEKAREDKEPLVRNAVMRALRGDRGSALFKAADLGV